MNARDIVMAKILGRGRKGMIMGWPAMLGAPGGGSGTEYTVTGVSPLVLAAALHKPIKSLVQSGKCAQATTPSPSSPVDIYCNNGKLVMVDDELPAAYKRVLGFACNNNSMWQISGFKLKGSDTVRISFSITAACNVFGCYQGTDATDNYDLYVSTTSNSKYLRYGSGTYLSYWSSSNLGARFDCVFTPTGTQGMPEDSTWTAKTFTSANDLLIGSTTTTGTSAKMKGSFYGDIIVDGRLHLIPCERLSDNVLGYYDTVSETFYPPYTGFDGAVSLGYDGSHYSLAVVGTDEVISITASGADTQTASAPDLFAVGDYADEVELISGAVTRKCRVVVFDGAENNWSADFNTASGTIARFYMNGFGVGASGRTRVLCTHFKYGTNNADGVCFIAASGHIFFERLIADGFDTKEKWLAYLAAQYAAGTPVIVIYPLAEETTESVTPQALHTNAGDNTIIVTAEVAGIPLSATYIKEVSE